MVGLIDDERHITTQWFKAADDAILLVGDIGSGIGGLHEIEEQCTKLFEKGPDRVSPRWRQPEIAAVRSPQ